MLQCNEHLTHYHFIRSTLASVNSDSLPGWSRVSEPLPVSAISLLASAAYILSKLSLSLLSKPCTSTCVHNQICTLLMIPSAKILRDNLWAICFMVPPPEWRAYLLLYLHVLSFFLLWQPKNLYSLWKPILSFVSSISSSCVNRKFGPMFISCLLKYKRNRVLRCLSHYNLKFVKSKAAELNVC